MNRFWLAAGTLWTREIVRFYRDRSRVVGALAPPIVFWFLIGSALSGTVMSPGISAGRYYLQFLFPGTMLLIILFTAIFFNMSVIEDRREGFLQSVLVAPVPRSAIVMGKVLGGATLAFLQGLTFMILAPFVGIPLLPASLPYVLTELWLASCMLTALGFWIAWRMDSTQGFHAIINLILLPLWLLSGSVFPAAGAPTWLRAVMAANPVTYCSAALQHGLLAHPAAELPGPWLSLALTAVFAIAIFAAGAREVSQESARPT